MENDELFDGREEYEVIRITNVPGRNGAASGEGVWRSFAAVRESEPEGDPAKRRSRFFKKLFLSIGYAAVFTFCLYDAPNGITYPVYAAATLAVFCAVLRLMGEKPKRSAGFYAAGIMALAVHVATTGSGYLIVIDKVLMYVLLFMLFLNSLYDDSKWDVARYCRAIFETAVSGISFIPNIVTEALSVRRDRLSGNKGAAERQEDPMRYIFLGLVLCVPLLIVIVPLLAASDAVFCQAVADMFEIRFDSGIVVILGMLFGMFAVSFALMTRFSKKIGWLCTEPKDARIRNPLTAITIMTVILIVYLFYCAIQVFYLFLGKGELPEGYTYASYVHEGFYELVFVCLINLVLVLVCRKYSRDHAVLRGMLTGICGCTYVMLGSSLYRMILYIDAYGFTFLRAFVLWALAVIALVLAAAVGLVYRASFPFVKCAAAVVAATWIVFAFSYPDRWIAAYNMDHGYGYEYTHDMLSTDAIPVIVDRWSRNPVLWDTRADIIGHEKTYRTNLEHKKDFRNFNVSEYKARKALDDLW
ncbi:MAG: DUF4173 domain-containing protein [Lachnospiraceae bacterium]|nr:DUF4173 domain-containing protein [Lachnospiraceae bacterium]